MSVNLSRLLSIVAFAIGVMAIYSVSSHADEITFDTLKNMDSGEFFFHEVQTFMTDVMSGSFNGMIAAIGTAAAGIGTGIITIVKMS
jgi:hypothetical protein